MNIDKLLHEYYEKVIEGDEVKWITPPKEVSLGEQHKYYYAGDELYLIQDATTGRIFFSKAKSLEEAKDNIIKQLEKKISEALKVFKKDL